jgi:hypothetical protein
MFVLHFSVYIKVGVWVMYMYSMEPCLFNCDSGSIPDFSVIFHWKFYTFVLSQWNLSTNYQMYVCFLGAFRY